MYQPRKSILQMFDPLMANSPPTPKREESTASPDNSDKENDAPRDPLSLTQYFNRTYHVKSSQQPLTPKGKLIDFDVASIDEDSELALPGPSSSDTEVRLDSGDALLSTPPPMYLRDEDDTENATSFPSDGPFVTPQNRKILGDIDVDALQPPKPPTKQGALKISFLAALSSGSPPMEVSATNAASSDPKADEIISGPVITLYPPTFDSIPPTSSAPQISDKVDSYLSSEIPLPRTINTFTPRRSPLSSQHASNRVSMDLQSSFQLQLQNGEYSFNLVNDKVSFLESSQELSFPESDDDLDMGEVVEDVGLDDMLKSLTLHDNVVVAATRVFSPTSEKLAATSIPEKDTESFSKSGTLRAVTPVSVPSQDVLETKPTTAALNVVKKLSGPTRRPSADSIPSVSGLKPVTSLSKPPVRVLVPPTKCPPSTTSTQRASMIRPPGRQSTITGRLPKPAVDMTKGVGKSTDGPRRVLVQAGDKPPPLPVSVATLPALKSQGPQRVLVRTVPGTTNPVKKPLGPSSSINPPATSSRLRGPSRIAVPNTSKLTTKTSITSKPAGRWV